MTDFTIYERTSGHSTFRGIAEHNLERFSQLDMEVAQLRERISKILSLADDPKNLPSEYYDVWMRLAPTEVDRERACLVGCVFTSLYLEAFIYDYAATYLGDKYVRDHLDKLDFISKWVVVPRLTVGKEIDKSGKAYAALKQLHRDRNCLVHFKTRPFNHNPAEWTAFIDKSENALKETTENCRTALTVVIAELAHLDPRHPQFNFLTL